MAFISQEAREKARELQVKADEEFAIEKACRIRASARQIDYQCWKEWTALTVSGKDCSIRVQRHRPAVRKEAQASRDWLEDQPVHRFEQLSPKGPARAE